MAVLYNEFSFGLEIKIKQKTLKETLGGMCINENEPYVYLSHSASVYK